MYNNIFIKILTFALIARFKNCLGDIKSHKAHNKITHFL